MDENELAGIGRQLKEENGADRVYLRIFFENGTTLTFDSQDDKEDIRVDAREIIRTH